MSEKTYDSPIGRTRLFLGISISALVVGLALYVPFVVGLVNDGHVDAANQLFWIGAPIVGVVSVVFAALARKWWLIPVGVLLALSPILVGLLIFLPR